MQLPAGSQTRHRKPLLKLFCLACWEIVVAFKFQGRRSKPEAEHHVQPLETLESVATLSFLFHQSPLLNSRLSDGVLTSAVTIVAATVLADSDQRATTPADCLQLL